MVSEVKAHDWAERLPWAVLAFTLALCAVGLTNLYSASGETGGATFWAQTRWYFVGIAAGAAVALVDYRQFERFAYIIYGAVVLLLVLVLVIGKIRMGAQRWLVFGPLTVQPSEFMKWGVILALARHYQRRAEPGPFSNLENWKPYLLLAVPFVLIGKQPDLGTAVIVMLIGMSVILFAGLKWRSLLALAVLGAGGGVVGWFFLLRAYQKQRILTFLNPEADALGAGYHANQSMIAIGSGGLTGKGWGQGTQTQLSFLPEQHTDFVFSVFCEEHGFVGALLVILIYTGLLIAAIAVAREAKDRFGALVIVGVAAAIFWQMFINIAMVTGIAPVVGVTLPLISYGGSSVVTVFMALGLIVNVYARRFVF